MSFQWIIDNAEQISIDRAEVVGQSITRNQTVRATSRGASIWKFTVKLPDGLPYETWRPYISLSEKTGRVTTSSIQIGLYNTGHRWINGYQGDSANYTGFTATYTKGQTGMTLVTVPTTANGSYYLRAGDIVQLGSSGRVYTVAADVIAPNKTVQLHRPIIDNSVTGGAIKVAENCSWTVICTQFPTWNLFAKNQVAWSGPFVFYENMV